MVYALTKPRPPMPGFPAVEASAQITPKPAAAASLPCVSLAHLTKPSGQAVADQKRENWKTPMQLRDSALIQLDKLKKEAGLNKALHAEVVYPIDSDALRQRLQSYGPDLEDLVGAGHHSFA